MPQIPLITSWKALFGGRLILNAFLFIRSLQNAILARVILFFWHDKWTNVPLSTKFPELYSVAQNDSILVASASSAESIRDLFHTPLSI